MCSRFLLFVLLLWCFVGSAAPAADPSLQGWWKFDETSGTLATDSSGNGRHGTLQGGARWVPGVLGGALELDGIDGRVVIDGYTGVAGTQSRTVMAWIRTTGLGDFISWGENATSLKYIFRVQANNGTSGAIRTEVQGGFIVGDTDVRDGEWHHAASVIIDDGSPNVTEVELYLDGVREGISASQPTAINTADTRGVWVGDGHHDRPFPGQIDDVRIYSRALTQEEIQVVMLGVAELASAPSPADGATDIPRDVVLSWEAGEFAATHDMYFGTVFDDVNDADRASPMDVLLSEGQAATDYDPPELLDFGTTYYWRIDEVNAPPDSTIFKGSVWSFITEPFAYPIENVVASSNGISDDVSTPERTGDGSGLDAADQHSVDSADMWLANAPEDEALHIQYQFDRVYKLHELLVWNYNVQFELMLGFGVKDVTIEYSEDGQEWVELGDVELNQATATSTYTYNTMVDLQGVAARFVRLTVNSGWGPMGQYGLSEVRFLYIPAQAREPQPEDGATDVAPETALSWRAGRDAASHEVYLGTDVDELALIDSVVGTSIVPDELAFGTTYYWQVDAVSDEVWAGDLWSFSTLEYQLIEGFESYTDDIDAGEAIFDTWLDGWVNETGSTVGYLETPFAEQTIVRSGSQSMPLFYDNTESPFYSETERTFDSTQDWTANGADTLRLFVAGVGAPFVETADGTVLITGAGADIWNTADEFRYVYKSLSGNGSMTVRVLDNGTGTNAWAKGGPMIRQSLEAGAINVMGAVTGGDGDGGTFQWRSEASAASESNRTLTGIAPPYWVRLTRQGNTFTVEMSADGEQWEQQGANPIDIAMQDPVLIGLAVTSHAAGELRTYEFDNISTTGNVTGEWRVADVGVEQGEGNAPAPLYVVLEDATGKVAVVSHPDLVIRGGWNEWAIPLSDFAGINTSRVRTMYIGVGSRTSPTAGGTGVVYIDDIAFGKPAVTE
ncbi:LamG-like jellyroll fold domain-containing protein [Anaerobaca lacustris]|uniref:Discoidin domain-containing protein n=1 Tax=Anaerobaca lacustris TaxID=3044600 RepID=A0AAW6U4G5_9BACT|nr:discoidin domain-containing protein [Sedimentisphaerales bacterium M17dextr]